MENYKFNNPATQELLNAISPLVNEDCIKISTSNKDYRGKECKSDLITIDSDHYFGFEVFDNEIIVSFFDDHRHFEDYSLDLEEGTPNYIERAKEFLTELFTYTVKCQRNYKGKTLVSEQYILIKPDGKEECPTGICVHSIFVNFIPFLPKRTETKIWVYDKRKGCFIEK